MALHKELFNDLPSKEDLMKNYGDFLRGVKEADGYYILVQDIAEKYGDKAYALAEEVFREAGMKYDPIELRAIGKVRRVGYAFEGINVFNINVEKYKPEIVRDIVRLYNNEMRKLSRKALLNIESFIDRIATAGEQNTDGLFAAYNEENVVVGFIHCTIDETNSRNGSVDALVFMQGRIHEPVSRKLVQKAREYFVNKKVENINILTGNAKYPFYSSIEGNLESEFQSKLGHIYEVLKSFKIKIGGFE